MPPSGQPTFPDGSIRNELAGIFTHTRNSYKFYFFLAFLRAARDTQNLLIPVEDLLIDMVATVWYPVNFFRLNFGNQDQLPKVVKLLRSKTDLDEGAKPAEVRKMVREHWHDTEIRRAVKNLGNMVPTRLIRPWFSAELRGMSGHQVEKSIKILAKESFNRKSLAPPYRWEGDQLFLNSYWITYIRANFQILHDFACWHLLEYLQKLNPHVPNLIHKLFPKPSRSGPEWNKARVFWEEFLHEKPGFECLYTGESLPNLESGHLDHFLPWSFVAHNQKWNLLPVSSSANSSKNNRLPELKSYLRGFAHTQQEIFRFHYDRKPGGQKLEDYTLFFQQESAEIYRFSQEEFTQRLRAGLLPQWEIAANMGFERNWKYASE